MAPVRSTLPPGGRPAFASGWQIVFHTDADGISEDLLQLERRRGSRRFWRDHLRRCFLADPAVALAQRIKWAAQARLLLNRDYQSLAYQGALRALQHNDRNEEAGRVLADMFERRGSPRL